MPTLHHLKTLRSARYYTLGEAVSAPTEVWLVCHGYGQLAERFLARCAALDDGRRLVVAPEALSRFYVQGAGGPDSKTGASWMTREDRLAEIEDYVRYLDGVYEAAAGPHRAGAELHVLGFSQGAATAARWAIHGAARVDRLVLWAGLLPPEIDLKAAADRLDAMRLTLVAGEHDDWVNAGLPLMVAGLDEAGIRYRVETFAGDHQIDDATLRRVAGA